MSVGFAGSRCLDERRRRRLAQCAETQERRAPFRAPGPRSPADPPFVASPVESVVRPQLWVHLLLGLIGAAVCGGTVVLGDWIDLHHPVAAHSFGTQGLLLRAVHAALFVIAAQLAFAILWYRARSRKDFNGRYRVWHFAVPSLLTFAFCTATDAQDVLADLAARRWGLPSAHAPLIWLVPAGTTLLAMVRLLHTEVRGTRGCAPCLWLSVIAATVNAAFVLDTPFPWDEQTASLIRRSVVLTWPYCLLMALLFYARRVIYVSNEPSAAEPAAPASSDEAARGWRSWWRRRNSERRRKPAAETQRTGAEVAAAGKVAGAGRDDRPARSAPPAEARPAERSPPGQDHPGTRSATAAPPAAPQRSAPAVSGLVSAASAAAASRTEEADDEEDADEDARFRGLRRKERKRLRKLQMQREREGLLR